MPTTAESVAAAFGLLWFWSAGRAIEECDSTTTIEATQNNDADAQGHSEFS
jgi:hypothetical protein